MTKKCVFFGHRWADLPPEEKNLLKNVVERLITEENVEEFFFGGYGNFDSVAYDVVSSLKKRYPHIRRIRALSYYPEHPENLHRFDGIYEGLYLLDGVEVGPKRFAIVRCNRILAQKCDFAVCYVVLCFGGAYRAMKVAKSAGKVVINIADF